MLVFYQFSELHEISVIQFSFLDNTVSVKI